MYVQIEKPKENTSSAGRQGSRAVANSVIQKKSNDKQGVGFVDKYPKTIAQRKMHSMGVIYSVQPQCIIQREERDVDGVIVDISPGYASWEMNGKWHINWKLGEGNVYHVTDEDKNPKIHYFFTLDAGDISDAVAPKRMKGKKGTSKKFSALPQDVQKFIVKNISDLIS